MYVKGKDIKNRASALPAKVQTRQQDKEKEELRLAQHNAASDALCTQLYRSSNWPNVYPR